MKNVFAFICVGHFALVLRKNRVIREFLRFAQYMNQQSLGPQFRSDRAAHPGCIARLGASLGNKQGYQSIILVSINEANLVWCLRSNWNYFGEC